MDTDSFIIYIKTEDVCEDVADHVENTFDRLKYEVNRSSPKRNYKKMIGLIKEEIKVKIFTKFVALTWWMMVIVIKSQQNKKMCNKTKT